MNRPNSAPRGRRLAPVTAGREKERAEPLSRRRGYHEGRRAGRMRAGIVVAPEGARRADVIERRGEEVELRYQRLGRLWLFEPREIARLKRSRTLRDRSSRNRASAARTPTDVGHANRN